MFDNEALELIEPNEETKPKELRDIKDLKLCDDFMFGQVMSDPEICKTVLEKVLGFSIRSLHNLVVESSISPFYGRRGIRLDVQVNDEKGTIYTVEMQTYNETFLGKRFRYYQGLTDVNSIFKGTSYGKLHEMYIIFFCTYDPFKAGRHIYPFHVYCDNDSDVKLDDGIHKIVISTEGHVDDIDDEMRILLKLIKDSNDAEVQSSGVPFVEQILDKIIAIRQNHKLGGEFMKYQLEMMHATDEAEARGEARGLAKGLSEGEAKKQLEIAANLFKEGLPADMIIKCTGLTPEQVAALAKP